MFSYNQLFSWLLYFFQAVAVAPSVVSMYVTFQLSTISIKPFCRLTNAAKITHFKINPPALVLLLGGR